MKKHLSFIIVALVLLLFSNTSFGQAPNGTLNLGILESFEAFTAAGGIANSGGTVTGDVGTNLGIISGFPSPPNIGNTYTANASTNQARYDLLRLYIHLNAKFVDFPNAFNPTLYPAHGAAFGGEILVPGVYSIGSAGSVTGVLTLDGGGNPDAAFVIKMNGAMTVAAGATVILTNGTKSSNVFYLINGAISVAAGATVKGTLFSKAGAVGLGAGVILEGRMLSLGGALTMGVGSSAIPPPLPTTIPVFCESICTPAPAVDILGVLSGLTLFAKDGSVGNTGISGMNGIIATNAGAITGYAGGTHIGTEQIANALTLQAASDLDAAYISLMAMTPSATHAATFLDETLAPGVYHIPTAGALGGVIILDAANDPNAIFVFRFAGAFNIAAATKMVLANGARRCNVFWLGGAGVDTGALNIGASCEVQGTFISHGGACNSGGGVFMSGRQLSTLGAVNTDTCVIYGSPECVTSKTLKTTAVTDSPSVAAGATTPSVIDNDISNGVQAVIGTSPGQVTLTFTNSGPLTMNGDGTIAVAANTSAGNYPITYTICEVSNPAICSTVTSKVTVTVTVPAILAVVDTPSVLAGTNTPSVIANDTVNGVQAVIGTSPGQVTLTSTNTAQLTMNADGTIAVAANTSAGTYPITYTICEVNNISNCSIVTSTVTVTNTATVAGTITADQSICKDSTPNDLTLTGNSGNVIKWQKSTDLAFTTPIDIASTSTTLSSLTIGTLAETTYFRAVVQEGSAAIEYSNIVTVTVPSTTWNGTSWDNGVPSITTTAYITGNYSQSTNLIACTLTVSNNAVVAIPSGNNVTLNGKLTVEIGSNFTLNDNSSLVQQTSAVNTGDITVKRISSPLYRLDYTLWSSPVSGTQKLSNFSPLTSNTAPDNIRFYIYNTLTNQYKSVNPVTTVFEQAKSYLIRTPNKWPSWSEVLNPAPAPWTGSFTGVPRNGSISLTMVNTGSTTCFNTVGNPYPSAISLDSFINENSNTIEGTLWFWRKYNDGGNLTSYSTCTTLGCVLNNNATYIDFNLISLGQGFIVKAKAGQTTLNFTNAMRSESNTNQFFKYSSIQMDRFWLKMTNAANGIAGQNLIAYTPNATTQYDSGLDGLYNNDSSVAFYSKAAKQEVVINARPSFELTDVVPLILKTNVADTYTFSLNQREGIFNGKQDILLRDNYTNKTYNLSQADYSFTTAIGSFTDRFEIIYQNNLGVNSSEFNSNKVIISNKDHLVQINTGSSIMSSLKIFDIQGRLLLSKSSINDTKTSLKLNYNNQVLLFHITSQEGDTIIKKVIN